MVRYGDVQKRLEIAPRKTRVNRVNVFLRPRLLSDNGPCYLSKELKDYLDRRHIEHTRSAPFTCTPRHLQLGQVCSRCKCHPMTQGTPKDTVQAIGRYHRSMKNVVNLQNYFSPEELEGKIAAFVDYYINSVTMRD